jgi:hypothetical protein
VFLCRRGTGFGGLTGQAAGPGQTVVYARVSSSDQRPDLDRQVARVTEWVTGRKLSVDRVVTEVGWLSVSDDESRARHTWDSNPS